MFNCYISFIQHRKPIVATMLCICIIYICIISIYTVQYIYLYNITINLYVYVILISHLSYYCMSLCMLCMHIHSCFNAFCVSSRLSVHILFILLMNEPLFVAYTQCVYNQRSALSIVHDIIQDSIMLNLFI